MRMCGPSACALALLLCAAPALRAQSNRVSVCKDGTTSTEVARFACVNHGGIDQQATARVQRGRNGRMDNRVNGTGIECADRTMSTSGIHGCAAHGGIASSSTGIQCADGSYSSSGIHGCADHRGVAGNQIPNTGRTDEDRDRGDRNARRPRNATGRCQDGVYTTHRTRRSACKKDGGVADWYGPGHGG